MSSFTNYEIAETRVNKAIFNRYDKIDLSNLNLAELPPSLINATNVKYINLSCNRLSSIPDFFTKLSSLRTLDLDNNNLKTIPDPLLSMSTLSELFLSSNQISKVPSSIRHMDGLELLNLSDNSIRYLPGDIFCMRNLTELNLSGNNVVELPKIRRCQSRLSILDLSNNSIEYLDETFGNLTYVGDLDLSSNRLVRLSSCIGKCEELLTLDLTNNHLKAIPEAIGKLRRLQALYLSDNTLRELPVSIKKLKALSILTLSGNNSLNIPRELLHHDADIAGVDIPTVLDYYFKSKSGTKPLNEVKLLLVGRGGSGKTSISRRIIGNRYSDTVKETKGVKISKWTLHCPSDDVTVNIWDFAGQEITHATHQMFLTQRSVYILVLTGREDCEKIDAEYWLRMIRAFATEEGSTSPVIVAMNKIESSPCKIDKVSLLNKYPFIVGFVETDCKSGAGIDELKKMIRSAIESMDSVRQPFPKAWWSIKSALSGMARDYLSFEEYRKLCSDNGETDHEKQDSLSRTLHVLGVALNYSEDTHLKESTILNPRWITGCVYSLLNSVAGLKSAGVVSMKEITNILHSVEKGMQKYIVEIMRKYDLAFPLSEHSELWLVPQCLPEEQPIIDETWPNASSTILRYRYTVLPKSFIPRLITRTYTLSEGQARWVNGVVLMDGAAKALIVADNEDRQITISVKGEPDDRRRMLSLVREEMTTIHRFFSGLSPIEEICVDGQNYVNVKALDIDSNKGKKSYTSTSHGTIEVDASLQLNKLSTAIARDKTIWKPKVFISYCHRDVRQYDELITRMKPMISDGILDAWSDRCIITGQDWDKTIKTELSTSSMVIFLVSASFEASGYIQGIEVKQAIEMESRGMIRICPIILEKCDWEHGTLGKYQSIKYKGKAIRDASPQRNAWHDVSNKLRQVLTDIIEDRPHKRVEMRRKSYQPSVILD